MKTHLPTTKHLLYSSWQILTQKWRPLFTLSLVPTLTTLLLFTAIGASTAIVSEQALEDIFTNKQLSQPLPQVSLALSGLLLVSFIITINLWFQVASLIVIKNRQRSPTFPQVISTSWPLVSKYWWTSVLGALAAIGGFSLLIIPGVLLSFWFSFAGQVVVDQNKSGLTALWTSQALVKNKILAVTGRYLGLIAIIILASFTVQAGSQLWITTMGETIGRPISTLANLTTSLGTNIFATIYTWLIYENLAQLKKPLQVQISLRHKLLTWGLAALALLTIAATITVALNLFPHLPSLQDISTYFQH